MTKVDVSVDVSDFGANFKSVRIFQTVVKVTPFTQIIDFLFLKSYFIHYPHYLDTSR